MNENKNKKPSKFYQDYSVKGILSKPKYKWTPAERALADMEIERALKSGFPRWMLNSPDMMEEAHKKINKLSTKQDHVRYGDDVDSDSQYNDSSDDPFRSYE